MGHIGMMKSEVARSGDAPLKRCKLTRIEGGSALRTSTVEGETLNEPAVGHPFVMQGKPLDPAASMRLVNTSPIVEITRGDDVEVSEYDDAGNFIRTTERWATFRVRTMSGSLYEVEVEMVPR